MSATADRERRAFVRRETLRLISYVYGDRPYPESDMYRAVAGAHSYRCECGYATTSPREIFDHCHGGCGQERIRQMEFDFGRAGA